MDPANDLANPAFLASLPAMNSQEGVPDPIVHAKIFTPDAGATWLILEVDKPEHLAPGERPSFFCFAYLGPHMADCAELGYVSLDELMNLRGPLGLRVERDLYWKPIPLSEAKKREFGIER